MDRNTITGIIIICALMFAWMWYMSPSKEQLEKQKKTADSLALVQKEKVLKDSTAAKVPAAIGDTSKHNMHLSVLSDSANNAVLNNKYDVFAAAAKDSNQVFTIENELLKASISKKGGRICSVVLKNYRRHDSTALELFDADSSVFNILFNTERDRIINTNELFFQPSEKNTDSVFAMRLYANADSTGRSNQYLEYEYTLPKNSYMLGFKIRMNRLENVVMSNTSDMDLKWSMKTPSQEQSPDNQRNNSTVYYKYADQDPDYISEPKNEKIDLNAKVKWIAFKQQFFTSVMIADDYFDKSKADVTSNNNHSGKYIKDLSCNLSIPFSHKPAESFGMKFYFGPLQYKELKKYDLGLERQIPLGWSFAPISWVNRFLVIPVFNFLNSLNISYAVIILLLTIMFKIILFPVAYKTYVSSAKMRVLKPEIDEINKRFGNEEPVKKQQATMALYKKAGVSPLAGCIPALLQMPILLALVRFFPSAIDLRQHGFWWVTDFSGYDSVWNFGPVPSWLNFIYGDHVSVWALLCTITTLIYTRMNSQLMSNPGQQQMAGMKYMMYIMPIMILPFLNKFSAGLSYYYTLANVTSFIQMWVIRKFMVDEKKLHAQIEEHKKKPEKAKSSFQQRLQKRLEDVQKNRNGAPQKKVK